MKRYLVILGGATAFGLLVAFITSSLEIPTDVVMQHYWRWGIVVIVLAAILNWLYFMHYARQIRAALPLLEEGNATAYIERLRPLYEKAKGRHLKQLLALNLSAGYADRKEYERAIAYLQSMEGARLPRAFRMVYALNMSMLHFQVGREAEGLGYYHAQSKALAAARNDKNLAPHVAILDILACIAEGKTQEAHRLLQEAKSKHSAPRLEEDYATILQTLQARDAASDTGSSDLPAQ